jgi:hypothetical protein
MNWQLKLWLKKLFARVLIMRPIELNAYINTLKSKENIKSNAEEYMTE